MHKTATEIMAAHIAALDTKIAHACACLRSDMQCIEENAYMWNRDFDSEIMATTRWLLCAVSTMQDTERKLEVLLATRRELQRTADDNLVWGDGRSAELDEAEMQAATDNGDVEAMRQIAKRLPDGPGKDRA